MDTNKTHLPPGTQDYLPRECAHKRQLEAAERALFRGWGYDEVETPCVEFLDVFRGGTGEFEQERMFKFTDVSGRLLALRPDLTMPLARLAATRLCEREVARLFYVGNAFQLTERDGTGAREFTQIGVELMGQSGPLADAEVIALAIGSLRAAGLKDSLLDIGQVEFFKGLMEEAGLTAEQAEEVRSHVEEKNMLSIELLMQKARVPAELRNRILDLPSLYGGPEVLDEAERYTLNPRSRAAVASLRRTLDALAQYGLEDCISLDLGMVQSIHYYSGVIFRGISRYLGYPLLTGGRYDDLVGGFGRELPATGFAFAVKPVLVALERQGDLGQAAAVDAVVALEEESLQATLAAVTALRGRGLVVEQYYGTPEGLAGFARSRGAAQALRFADGALRCVWQEGAR
jgi:ATP phosphoribosyltransferase regulatory subunit